eukprot:7054219-Alexandrium_andersonii.AAC.2
MRRAADGPAAEPASGLLRLRLQWDACRAKRTARAAAVWDIAVRTTGPDTDATRNEIRAALKKVP